ncbi:unnamed protein product, partial [Callosobruchus maculatus]
SSCSKAAAIHEPYSNSNSPGKTSSSHRLLLSPRPTTTKVLQVASFLIGHHFHIQVSFRIRSLRATCCRSIDCFGRGDNDLPFGSMLSGDAWLFSCFFWCLLVIADSDSCDRGGL